MKTFLLPIGWTSNEHIHNPEFVKIELSKSEIEAIKKAQQFLKTSSDYDSLRMNIGGELLDGDKEPDDDFAADVQHLIVYKEGGIHYYAQHKHDSGSQIESESFNLKANCEYLIK